MWYDKQGKLIFDFKKDPIEKMKEVEKLIGDADYKIIKQQDTYNKKYFVSTVWIGLNHNFVGGEPLIFETMAFKNIIREQKVDDEKLGIKRETVETERYPTLEEAKKGHKKIFKKWNKLKK